MLGCNKVQSSVVGHFVRVKCLAPLESLKVSLPSDKRKFMI